MSATTPTTRAATPTRGSRNVAFWNLHALAQALLPLVGDTDELRSPRSSPTRPRSRRRLTRRVARQARPAAKRGRRPAADRRPAAPAWPKTAPTSRSPSAAWPASHAPTAHAQRRRARPVPRPRRLRCLGRCATARGCRPRASVDAERARAHEPREPEVRAAQPPRRSWRSARAREGDFGEVQRLLQGAASAPSTNNPSTRPMPASRPTGRNTWKSPVPHDRPAPPPRRPALRGTQDRRRVARRARPDAVPGGAPRRHRARLQRQVLGPLATPGRYHCVGCGTPLFESGTKFDAGCGWPSYWQPINSEVVERVVDASHGMVRVEVRCNRCGSHLGHVFEDGPEPTGERFCINSAAIDFKPQRDPPSVRHGTAPIRPP